jgi:amidase
MKCRVLLIVPWFVLLAACGVDSPPDLAEADIGTLRQAMDSGEISALEITDYYLERIASIDHGGVELHAVIEINPDARDIAQALDRERRESGVRGPLHGIPVILKANIDTADRMATSAGSLALAEHRPPDDAFIVARLRDAGAVILGKGNLSEWANFRSARSSSGWSSIGGQTHNAYDPLRNPCGSSSGSAVAVAANLTALAVGTETDGSIVCPSSINGIVGIKPTLGLVSRDGIIPIAHSQDTAGPMARTVEDAAIMLNVLAADDTDDPAAAARPATLPDYAAGLREDGLRGKRIGVLRSYSGAGENERIGEILDESIALMKAEGAVIVDPVEIDTEGMGDAEYAVLLYEFKADLNDYLASSGAPYASLEELIAFNNANAATVMPFFGQEIFEQAQEKGPLSDEAYLEALAASKRIARDGIDAALATHRLDALIAPSNGPAWMTDHVNGDNFSVGSSSFAAVSGYASVTVPAGNVFGLPIGLSVIGGAFSERKLIEIAYAFEQHRKARRVPTLSASTLRAGTAN